MKISVFGKVIIFFSKSGKIFRKFPIYLKIYFQNLKNSQFFINFRNGIFQKYFFSDGFFSTIFFPLRIFWGVGSMQKLVLFRFIGFAERFRHSFTSFGANLCIWYAIAAIYGVVTD